MENDPDDYTNTDLHIANDNETIGDYLLQERLGNEHSFTYRGIHRLTQELVSIKLFDKSLPLSRKLYEIEIEAYQALSGLSGILPLRDHGENGEARFIVTEFIKEGSLRNILNQYPDGMAIENVIQLFTPIAEAIDHIHSKHIIHRDLKPENILVRKTANRYEIFITDFGIVKFTTDSQQFQTENTAGTAWYIAPEALVADPKIPQSKAVDIYGLGVMLYEALEGRMPFNQPTDALNSAPLSPDRTRRTANTDVVKYLLRPLNKDPEQRPKSAKEVLRGIRNAHEGRLSPEQKWEGREFGNYVVEKVLAGGKMGITLLAKEKQAQDLCVLKVFERSPFGSPVQAFNNEIRSLEKLENGHGVLTPRYSFEAEGVFFIVTDYKGGGDLRHLLNRKPKGLKLKEILEIFTQLAESIDYIHENKVIHRDIKPENVVFSITDGKYTPFLTDFGISVILQSAKSSFQTEHSAGTYRYMAPELWKPKAKKTKALDIYSFGVMLYEALEGEAPFDAEYPAIMHQHINEAVPLPKNTLKELGPDAQNILLQALSKNAEERPKTATEIVQQMKGQYTKFLGKEFGKYTIDKFIGQGSYGSTYRAYDTDHKRKKFALKILSSTKPNLREISKLKELGNLDGVLPILDGGTSDNDIPYIVTEYLNGNSLRDMLQNYPHGIGLDETLSIFKPIAKTLDALHSAGAAHGDIKPENIVFQKVRNEDSYSRPLITDYGISKVAGKTQSPHLKIDLLAGNFAYMAPELWEEKEPSVSTDIYALGVMVYEALEGTLPFNAKSLLSIMRQHLHDPVPEPKNLLKQNGEEAVSVLLKALHKDPQRRHKSTTEFLTQLQDAARDQTTTGTGSITGPLKRPLKQLVGKKITWPVWGFAGLILLGSLGISLFARFAQPTATPTLTSTQPQQTSTPPATTPIEPTTTQPPLPPPPKPVSCASRYPPLVDNPRDYHAENSIALQALYKEMYGPLQDFLDIYAIAYYNNRKALEAKDTYFFIDPENLIVSPGAKIYLPPRSWIDSYRAFPIPILEELSANPAESSIHISGTELLYPLSLQMATCFEEITTGYQISAQDTGTTAVGLDDYCQGDAYIFGTSKDITSTMKQKSGCSEAEFLRFEVAKSAIALFINEKNPHAADLRENPLTKSELVDLLTTATSWSEVRRGWSAEPVHRCFPSAEGEAFEIVKAELFPVVDSAPALREMSTVSSEYLAPHCVATDPYGIGFSNYSYYKKYKDDLRLISIDNVLPGQETIANEKYPLARSLYLYTGKTAFDHNPLVRYFINYYLTYELEYLDELGYFDPNRENFLGDQFYPKQDK